MKSMFRLLIVTSSLVCFNAASAQNNKDTIKTPVPKDPMVVNPDKTGDNMNASPAKPNDAIVVMSDTGFINKNIEDNMQEIALAKQGLAKGNAQVKRVAATIIKDHSMLLKQLRAIAAKSAAKPNKPSMPAMPKLQGSFNAAWASEMLNMHAAKLSELENYMATAQDAAIKAFAGRALPLIRMHKQMLQKIPGAKVTTLPNTAVQ